MFQTIFYTIPSEKIPEGFDGYRIAHLSDLHGALHGTENCELLEAIDAARPQIVVMTGDMADESRKAIPLFLNLCRKLCMRYPVYFVMGNHEQCLKHPILSGLLQELGRLGMNLLENRWCTVSYGGAFVKLYGLVTPLVYYKDPLGEYQRGIHFSADDTRNALGSIDDSSYNIHHAHNPLNYPSYRDWGADLTLSGHVHGGVIRLPGIGGLLSPDLSLFPKYDGGHFEESGRHLIVSRGLGNRFLIRVRNPEELVIITLSRTGAGE